MKSVGTGFVGAVIEAWQELRIHKTRVLLSLIGVAVAVCSLTTVVGLGSVARQAMIETSERSSGRPAALNVSVGRSDGSPVDRASMQDAWDAALERFDIRYASRHIYGNRTVQFVDGAQQVTTEAVDVPYGTMHRIGMERGNWFGPTDSERLAPAVVINTVFWQRLGSPALNTHPTVKLLGDEDRTAVVIGVTKTPVWQQEPSMYMLVDAYAGLPRDALAVAPVPGSMPPGFDGGEQTQYELWVPPALADPLSAEFTSMMEASLGEGAQASVDRIDYAAWGNDPFLPMQLMVGGVAVLVLLLGALGLLNIAMVTVKQRIREIGVRRSFGATAGRVFFAVMMESVVATVAAGALGVVGAILIVKNPWMEGLIGQGMVQDFPPFPVEAALTGILAATAVGALAGLLPALVAIRVRVIDAIRY